MNRQIAALAPLSLSFALALGLAGCASQGNGGYPSLARRDAERIAARAEPVAAPQAPALPPPSGDIESRIAQLVSQAREAHATFAARRPAAQRAASGARASAGSESWTDAQVTLADLEAARARATIALAELDRLYAEERLAHSETESPTATALAAARDEVAAWVAEEDRTIDALSGG